MQDTQHDDTQRIVITGAGMVSPLGTGAALSWRRLIAGQSGLGALPEALAHEQACRVAGFVKDTTSDPAGGFDVTQFMDVRDARRADRFIHFAIAAAQEALAQSGWRAETEAAAQRTATVIASGIGGFPAIAEAVRLTEARGVKRLSPFTIPSFLVNLAAGHISIRHGFKGPLGAPATACAASVQAIGDGARLIRSGEADVAVCGGSEATIDVVSLGSFAAAKALSTAFNAQPALASRPFDAQRDGFVMGEGAAVVVIESLAHARARGAAVLAEVLGYGTSADAHHITASPADGSGMQAAMRTALSQARLHADDIDYLSAHATSTPVGDLAELRALRAVFGEASRVSISSVKSALGHLLGAAGTTSVVFAIQALREQIVPMTLNLDAPDAEAAGLDLVRGEARRREVRRVMVNGFGFGGVNASLILGQRG